LSRILIGMHDTYSGLNMETFTVTADVAMAGAPARENLASKFKRVSQGVWQLDLPTPLSALERGKLVVSVCDRQGNESRIERVFSVGK
jgi:hypothetical protein